MFDHVGVRVVDIDAAGRFYDAILRPLGYERTYSDAVTIGYGVGEQSHLWLHASHGGGSGAHLAFAARDHGAIQAFHAAGLAAGGTNNGAPGPRPDYGPTYFAGFLVDPDGNNVEAVCTREVA